jgi:hypothetical protein
MCIYISIYIYIYIYEIECAVLEIICSIDSLSQKTQLLSISDDRWQQSSDGIDVFPSASVGQLLDDCSTVLILNVRHRTVSSTVLDSICV